MVEVPRFLTRLRTSPERAQPRFARPAPAPQRADGPRPLSADEAKAMESFRGLLEYKNLAIRIGGDLAAARAELNNLREQIRLSEHREARAMDERDIARREVTVLLTHFDSIVGQIGQMRTEIRSVRMRQMMPERVPPPPDEEAGYDKLEADIRDIIARARSVPQPQAVQPFPADPEIFEPQPDSDPAVRAYESLQPPTDEPKPEEKR